MKCDSKDRNICMTGRKKCPLMFVKMNKSGSGVCRSVGFISECGRGVNARGCGRELSRGTIQTSKTHFLPCKQVSSEVSRQLRLLRYQANLSSSLLPKHTLDYFLACTYLHMQPRRLRSNVKFTFSASLDSQSSTTSSCPEELGYVNTSFSYC